MMNIRKSTDRGHANHGWLDTWHTFSFADYHDPNWMGFRDLRVINDDIVHPGSGFGKHPHRDMEIITYILSGELQHGDSMGNGRVIKPGEFQYMAAGTGVVHSEFNPSEKEAVHLLQIWILPDRRNAKPAYAEKKMADAAPGKLHLIASKTGRDSSISVNQDADLYLARFSESETVTHALKPGRHAWVHVAEGQVNINGNLLKGGDAVALSEEAKVELAGHGHSQVLLFDLA